MVKSAGEGNTTTTKESPSDCATVLAHAATDDAAVGSEMTCRNNAVSAAQAASESAARLTDDSASSEEDLGEALRAASNEPALIHIVTTPMMTALCGTASAVRNGLHVLSFKG